MRNESTNFSLCVSVHMCVNKPHRDASFINISLVFLGLSVPFSMPFFLFSFFFSRESFPMLSVLSYPLSIFYNNDSELHNLYDSHVRLVKATRKTDEKNNLYSA